MKKLFGVYGTLKRGHCNHSLLHGAKFLGTTQTEPKYTLYDGGFPVVERGGDTPIFIEVFETDNPLIVQNVYDLEGFNGIKGHPDNRFYDVDEVETPHGKVEMFVMHEGRCKRSKKIYTGKWH